MIFLWVVRIRKHESCVIPMTGPWEHCIVAHGQMDCVTKHKSESMPAIEHCLSLLIEGFRLKSIMPIGSRIHLTMHRMDTRRIGIPAERTFPRTLCFQDCLPPIPHPISTSEVTFRNHNLIQDCCLYLAAGVSEIELSMDRMSKDIFNSPMWFWAMTFMTISTFSLWNALLYCLKTSSRAFPTVAHVLDALYFWTAEETGWGSFCWER